MTKKLAPGLLAGTAALALSAAMLAPAAASPVNGSPGARDTAHVKKDNRLHPLARKQIKLRKEALELVATGKAEPEPQPAGGSTVTLASGETVEFFDNNKQANVWTVLSEFGTQSVNRYGSTPGPLHNQIPAPVRSRDNSTQWTADFNRTHYDQMFNGAGESFRNFYLNQSNGQYDARVTTEDWVQVPYNASYYGDNAREDNGGTWEFINHTVDAWAARKGEGAKAYLAQFDQWDRYDFDEDDNFNEADGYIDHFQAVHAGEGEEAGADPDMIWSHRWFADSTTTGSVGPVVNGRPNKQGGQEIGNTGYFIGDYTVEPENGGLGVFAHEYGHDLGLPDFYDTNAGENGTAFWTLMSSGSWMGHGSEATGFDVGIGGTPNDMGAEEKLYLGWLNPTVVAAGKSARVSLGAAGAAGTNQAVQVLLPDQTRTRNVGASPFAGTRAWYSNSGDEMRNSLVRDVPAANTVTIDAQAWYDTEEGYDFWYPQYSTDGGATWQSLETLSGQSGGWVSKTFTYQANNQPSKFRFLYQTDTSVSNPGVMLDQVRTSTDGTVVDTDGAETDTSAWTPRGWLRTTGTITETLPRYYLMENKSYVNYDDTLRTGPYNFSEAVTRPNWVEHFRYQNGMLVWYVNHAFADNDNSVHAGEGYALPVDAMSAPLKWSGSGALVRNRIQSFDSTFGLETTDRLSLSRQVPGRKPGSYTTETVTAPARKMVSTFNDSNPLAYYDPANPQGSVKVAGVGVVAKVVGQTADTITVRVSNP